MGANLVLDFFGKTYYLADAPPATKVGSEIKNSSKSKLLKIMETKNNLNQNKAPDTGPEIILHCSSCNENWKMSSYWFNIWEEKKAHNKKYKGIRCKHCGKYTVKLKGDGEQQTSGEQGDE